MWWLGELGDCFYLLEKKQLDPPNVFSAKAAKTLEKSPRTGKEGSRIVFLSHQFSGTILLIFQGVLGCPWKLVNS